MKNIHILPTDKPSRLYTINSIDKLDWSEGYLYQVDGSTNQNIYITSDEEIKEGVWHLVWLRDKWEVLNYMPSIGYRKECLGKEVCKIILTTDQDLIKDGVQAIDDEFLQWIVKNPSCERVEVKCYSKFNDGDFTDYKIIIPKEESILKCDICKMYPRLEGTNKCESCYSSVRHVLEQDPRFKDTLLPDLRKKQETLEEAAERLYDDNLFGYEKYRDGFINGAKWQQEQDKNKYSEEDLISLLEFNYKKETNQLGTLRKDYSQKIVREWFEQFKNK